MAVSTLGKSDPRQPKIYRGGSQVAGDFLYGDNEANSQVFTIGHFVYANSGAITASDSSTLILGLAAQAATEVTSGNIEIPVMPILPGDLLLIQVEDGSGNPEASDTTCVKGTMYGIKDYSANVPSRIDSSNSAEHQFIYLGPQLDAAGDSSYWGWFVPVMVGTTDDYIQTAQGQ